MPERFGGGSESQVHPIIVVAMVVACALILLRPRKYVMTPFLAAAFLIPMDQVLVLGAFHFQMLRILIAFGWVAMLLRNAPGKRIFSSGFNGLDKAVILWAVFTAIAMVALWQDTAALNNQAGTLYTVLGLYFISRSFIRDEEDVLHAIRSLAYVSAVVALIMLSEQITHSNPYVLLGGSRAWTRATLMVREGGLRALGPFQHPILAGTFGAISLPLYFALWYKDRKTRKTALLGMLAASIITFTTQSSTPLLAYAGGIAALCAWPARRQMRLARRALVVIMISLHLAMKAPVWALIARVDLTGGSSGYHRYMLVDECIRHFSDWWLFGVKETGSWGWDMWDLANQYVAVAATSGLLPLIFFMAILVFGFKYLGRMRKTVEEDRQQERFIWALCAALVANCVAFFGISYFDQTMVSWYLLLAMIVAVGPGSGRLPKHSASVARLPSPTIEPNPLPALQLPV